MTHKSQTTKNESKRKVTHRTRQNVTRTDDKGKDKIRYYIVGKLQASDKLKNKKKTSRFK